MVLALSAAITVGGGIVGSAPASADDAATGGGFTSLPTATKIIDTSHAVGIGGKLASGSTNTVQVLGVGGIPTSGVSAVSVNIEAINPAMNGGFAEMWPDGTAQPSGSLLNLSHSQAATDNSAIVAVGANGKVDVYSSAGPIDFTVTVNGYFTSASDPQSIVPGGYIPITQARVADTRTGTGTPQVQIPASGSINVQVDGVAGIYGESAVAANLTVPVPSAAGSLYAYPTGGTAGPSQLSFAAGATDSIGSTVAVGSNGMITLKNGSTKPIDVAVDVSGYFTDTSSAGSAFTPVQSRILDTRTTTAVPAGGNLDIPIGGTNGIPTIFGAAAVNFTILSGTAKGFLTAWPTGQDMPGTSFGSFDASTISAAMSIVQPGTQGSITVHNQSATPIQLVVDLEGWFAASNIDLNELIADATPEVGTAGTDISDPAYAAAPQDLSSLNAVDLDGTSGPQTMSANGVSYWGGFHYSNYYIPAGQMYGQIDGSGLNVKDAGGDFITYQSICAWNIDQAFYNTSGKLYYTAHTATHSSCNSVGKSKYNMGFKMQAGKSCSILYAQWRAVKIKAVCFTIHN